MQVLLYARESSEEQTKGDAVSLDEQLGDMKALAERNSWQVISEYIDCKNYKDIQTPKRGKMVNPSGERADRLEFLTMPEEVKSGRVDAVVCWRDDRLMRHPRVAIALEDVLVVGDGRRPGRGEIETFEATGARPALTGFCSFVERYWPLCLNLADRPAASGHGVAALPGR